MDKKLQNPNRKLISRLAGKTSGWLKTHKMHLLAVGFMCAAVGLGTIEANTIYAANEGDYGENGETGSATYVSGGNIKVFPLEPAVTGVSVESYDFNEFLKTKYKYSGDKNNATNASGVEKFIESWENSHKDKFNNPYPYWIQTGTDKNGKAIYKYCNNSHHMITQNMLLNQTSKSFNKGTLIYVPKNISKLWIAKKEHSKVIVNGNTCKSAVNNLHFNYTYWYKDLDNGAEGDYNYYRNTIEEKVVNKSGSGIYYNKLKKYIKQQTKKQIGKTYITFVNGDGNPQKGGGDGKKAKVADYSQISKLTKTELNKMIDSKTLDKARKGQAELPKPAKRAQQLIGSIANIAQKGKTYVTYAENAQWFLHCTTTKTVAYNQKTNLTDDVFADSIGKQFINDLVSVSGNIYMDHYLLRNLFQGNKRLNDYLDSEVVKGNLSYLQKTVINNEYNLHYLDLLVCGYADAYASGGAASADPWWEQIKIYVKNADKSIPYQKNVVFRVDVGMAADVNGTVYYTSVGDMYAQQYGFYSNSYSETKSGSNSKGLNKGFVGFATASETATNNYQALNKEVSNDKGVVSASKMKKNYSGYYSRLKKAISSNKKVTKDNAQTWYGRTIMTRVTNKYYLSDKNGKVTEAYGNALNAVELLKMQSPNNGAYKSISPTERQKYAYGTYAIDGFNWIYPSEDEEVTSGYKLYIYSKTAEGNKNPKSNGSNIKKKFETVTINKKAAETATYNQKDDVYVKLAVNSGNKIIADDFKKIMNSKDYYVQVEFINSSKTAIDGEKNGKEVKSFKYKGKTIAPKQIKKVTNDFNKYSSALAKSEKNQNYNILVNGKSVGGKVAIENDALIWHVKNTTLAEKGIDFKGAGRQYVSWRARVYIYKRVKGDDGKDKWINIADTTQVKTVSSKKNTITLPEDAKYFETNNVIAQYTYTPTQPPIEDEPEEVDLSGTYFSTPQAYAELKEGSIYNETFEAMAGVPTTRTLYFATGGSEFIVNMQAVYDDYRASSKDSYRTTRTYKSVFKENDCEYKKGDTLKPLEAGQTKTETFVSDNEDKKNEKTVTAEKNNAVNPTGASSYNTTVKGHDSATKFEATWTGTIANNTPAWTKVGSNTSPTGKPCEGGNAGKVYSISTKLKNSCCYHSDDSSFFCAFVTGFVFFGANPPAGHDGVCLSQCGTYAVGEVRNLCSVGAGGDIDTVSVHLIEKTNGQCHSDIVQCSLTCGRKSDTDNLTQDKAVFLAFRVLLCMHQKMGKAYDNHKIHNA